MFSKVAIIGHFGAEENCCDGQTVKTRIVTEEIEKALGAENAILTPVTLRVSGLP